MRVYGIGAFIYTRDGLLQRSSAPPCNLRHLLPRTVMDDQHLIAGAQGPQGLFQEPVFIRDMNQGGDFRHEKSHQSAIDLIYGAATSKDGGASLAPPSFPVNLDAIGWMYC